MKQTLDTFEVLDAIQGCLYPTDIIPNGYDIGYFAAILAAKEAVRKLAREPWQKSQSQTQQQPKS